MTDHAVLIAGGGPTGLMLAGELALAGVDVAVVERRSRREPACGESCNDREHPKQRLSRSNRYAHP